MSFVDALSVKKNNHKITAKKVKIFWVYERERGEKFEEKGQRSLFR